MSSQSLAELLPAPMQLLSSTHIATLWSSYGHIYRLSVLQSPSSAPSSLILKTVKPPAAQSGDESHLRKLVSYHVERYFYSSLVSRVGRRGAARVAKCYPLTGDASNESLLLEDLEVDFPRSPGDALGLDRARTVLKWLASFHAAFWGLPNDPALLRNLVPPPLEVLNPSEAQGAWAQGGYWYLDTRQEEFSYIRGEWAAHISQFQAAAKKLKTDCRGRTLIHGDCKAANILFSADSSKCALYDFQYVGGGLVAQDLVYFLGTSVSGALLRKKKGDEELLEFYYSELQRALNAEGVNVETENFTLEVLKEQFEVALVDWMRFMAGWGRWGNASWVETNVRKILKKWAEEGCIKVSS